MAESARPAPAPVRVSKLPSIRLVQLAFWDAGDVPPPGDASRLGLTGADRPLVFSHAPRRLMLYSPTGAGSPDPLPAIDKGCATDLSHSRVGHAVSGPEAERVLSTLFALDFSLPAFPVGHGCATAHHQAPVLLVRMGEDTFHCLVGRSFDAAFRSVLTSAAPGARAAS